jgi:phenylacetate-CoA ligase
VEVAAFQRNRLAQILTHAARHSKFYARNWGISAPSPDDIIHLQPTNKSSLLIEGFDSALTVSDLNRKSLRMIIERKEVRQKGKFIAVSTSGTTGEPVVMPYSRAEWREGMAHVLRSADMAIKDSFSGRAGVMKTLSERPRIAGIGTLNPIHVSAQLSASFRVGLVPSTVLPSTYPIDRQIEELNQFRPSVLGGYPSAIRPLALAALDGALNISPKLVFCGGETVSPGLRRLVRQAWGINLFDSYGLTETLVIAGECSVHKGMHIYEDAVLMEVVDEKGRLLPPGEKGAGVYLTSLINRTLPVIRYAVSDIITITNVPCPCGSPFKRIVSIEGRVEEMLRLRKVGGGTVQVHPFAIESALEEAGSVRQFKIQLQNNGCVKVEIIPMAGISADPMVKVSEAVFSTLEPLGVDKKAVSIIRVDRLESVRGSTGKLLKI